MRTTTDALWTGVAWAPMLALLTATVLAVLSGIMWFEASFRATSYLV